MDLAEIDNAIAKLTAAIDNLNNSIFETLHDGAVQMDLDRVVDTSA